MPQDWANYDPIFTALLRPEERHPYGLYSAGEPWPLDAICAEFARLAYVRFDEGDGAKLAEAMAKAGFRDPQFFPSPHPGGARPGLWRRLSNWVFGQSAQAFGATSLDGALTIVAFRGTQADRVQDLLADFAAWPVGWGGPGRVHGGFWRTYRSLQPSIDQWLQSVPPGRLIATGHSLGGAMATCMAAARQQAELVTFGSPLVGNRAFADMFAGRAVRRYVDCTDVVTNVPPSLLGYVHVGEMRYIDREGTVRETLPDREERKQDQEEANRLYRRKHAPRPGAVPVRFGADHAPVNYVSAVAGLRQDP